MSARVRLLMTALALAASLQGCAGGGEDRVVIYSGRTRNLVGPLLERFAKQTGIGVDVRWGDSADLALLLEQEGDRSPADVFLSQSPGAIGFLASNGRLAELPPSITGAVDERWASRASLWVGVSARVRVLAYNPDLVDPSSLPGSVLDLVRPEYRGKVAVAPTNGSFQDFVTGMRLALGDDATLEWLSGMRRNDSPTYANNNAIVEAVARGEVPMGLVNHYYVLRQHEEDPDAASANHAFPPEDLGSLAIASGVGMLRGTDHRDAAQRLIAFLLSEEAQRYFAEETFEFPLAAGVKPASGVPPMHELGARAVDLDRFGGGLERTKELIDRSGLERS